MPERKECPETEENSANDAARPKANNTAAADDSGTGRKYRRNTENTCQIHLLCHILNIVYKKQKNVQFERKTNDRPIGIKGLWKN